MVFIVHQLDDKLVITNAIQDDDKIVGLRFDSFPTIKYIKAAYLSDNKIAYDLIKLKTEKINVAKQMFANSKDCISKTANAEYLINNSDDVEFILNFDLKSLA